MLFIKKESPVFYTRLVLAVWGLLMMLSTGCGGSTPKLYPVSGTVTYEGKPLADASLLFIPQQGRPSVGTTDASGKYTMTTSGQPGAPAGTYSVTVSKSSGQGSAGGESVQLPSSDAQVSEEEVKKVQEQMQQQMMGMQQKQTRPKPAIPQKYALPEGSGLTAIVTADPAKNVFNFELTP